MEPQLILFTEFHKYFTLKHSPYVPAVTLATEQDPEIHIELLVTHLTSRECFTLTISRE
jgi:hypothetical protein